MVADLAFADLALWFPHPEFGYIALAHVRPSTSHTVFHADFVGEGIRSDLRPLVEKAWNSRSIERSSETSWSSEMALRVEAVPMVRNGRTLAVVTSHMDLSSSRMPSRLELTYRQCAYDLLRMGTLGLWPDFASPTGSRRGAPRVGDGLIRLDAEGIVQYASPNGVSAFRRLGEVESLEGRSLAEVTAGLLKDRRMVDETLPLVVTGRMPWRSEIESRGVSLSLRAIPLRDEQHRFGALVLCRDVSELRRREMELVTKDATIREIHHRVKNNLQTVAALLRLQARRLPEGEAGRAMQLPHAPSTTPLRGAVPLPMPCMGRIEDAAWRGSAERPISSLWPTSSPPIFPPTARRPRRGRTRHLPTGSGRVRSTR